MGDYLLIAYNVWQLVPFVNYNIAVGLFFFLDIWYPYRCLIGNIYKK